MDFSSQSSSPNKTFIEESGISNVFKEEVLMSDLFFLLTLMKLINVRNNCHYI